MSGPAPLVRRAVAEGIGTAGPVAVVVGSGVQATEPPREAGGQLPPSETGPPRPGPGCGPGAALAAPARPPAGFWPP
ncbi:predicted protein [Streptomyces viridosporus ATCC 14672]|uniref:Predicted protein n=1 Tax=Streptomyces viridosporus (strain ATCC 14672 / DSM 40746 / JCM 4963 / KCTC 9882 / NRRL B-12104 / FH 1290) TaxID=566461 RepID=D6AAL7_STRV1|nr:predicted protein [Streptomyces viridosporus ATCC 14672]